MADLEELVGKIKETFPEAIEETAVYKDEHTIRVKLSRLLEVSRFLKEDPSCGFDFLSDLCGVDYLGRAPRFEVVYHLYSMKHRHRLRMKTSPRTMTLPCLPWFLSGRRRTGTSGSATISWE